MLSEILSEWRKLKSFTASEAARECGVLVNTWQAWESRSAMSLNDETLPTFLKVIGDLMAANRLPPVVRKSLGIRSKCQDSSALSTTPRLRPDIDQDANIKTPGKLCPKAEGGEFAPTVEWLEESMRDGAVARLGSIAFDLCQQEGVTGAFLAIIKNGNVVIPHAALTKESYRLLVRFLASGGKS